MYYCGAPKLFPQYAFLGCGCQAAHLVFGWGYITYSDLYNLFPLCQKSHKLATAEFTVCHYLTALCLLLYPSTSF